MEKHTRQNLDKIKSSKVRAILEKHLTPEVVDGPSQKLIDMFGKEAATRMWEEGKARDRDDRQTLGEDY